MKAPGPGDANRRSDHAATPAQTTRPKPSSAAAARSDLGLLERFLALFTDLGDPEWEKKHQLRLIEKQLRISHQKLYNPRRSEALPGLAAVFYSIYRVLAPARGLIGRAESSNLLRTLLIESSLSPTQKSQLADLQDDAIAARARSSSGADFAAAVKADLDAFVAGFDPERCRAINVAYAHLMALLDLVHFDFYFFLRKFDAALPEASFGASPHFATVDAGSVVEDLRELWDCILAIDTATDWDPLLAVLRTYRDVEIVPRDGWKRVLQALNQLKRSRLLELIIKHAEGDPAYRPHPAVRNDRIVDGYLQKFRTQVDAALQRLVSDQKGRRLEELVRAVFGTPPRQLLLNYADRSNAELRGVVGTAYTQTVPLNTLFAYLQDHFDKEMRPVVDLLLIRGKWTSNQASQRVSEALHSVLQHRDKLSKLDESLGEEGDAGLRIAAALRRAEKSRGGSAELRKILQGINTAAGEITSGVLQSLVALGRTLKDLIEDCDNKRGELIVNWRELDAEMGHGVRAAMAASYKRLYHLVQLMQMLART